MNENQKSCLRVYLKLEVQRNTWGEKPHKKPFCGKNPLGYMKYSELSREELKIRNLAKFCLSIRYLEDFKSEGIKCTSDLFYVLEHRVILRVLLSSADQLLVKWAIESGNFSPDDIVDDLCSSKNKTISSIGHKALKEFFKKLDKKPQEGFADIPKDWNIGRIARLTMKELGFSSFRNWKNHHSSGYLKILFRLYQLENIKEYSEREGNKFFVSGMWRSALDGNLLFSEKFIDQLLAIKSLKDLDKFADSEYENIKEFLKEKETLEKFSFFKNKGIVNWVLSNENTALITILNLSCSKEISIAASARKHLNDFLGDLKRYPSENLYRFLKANHLGEVLSLTRSELIKQAETEQPKVEELQATTWWSFLKNILLGKAQVGKIS